MEMTCMANQYRELIAQFLAQVAADPAFRQRLLSDPHAALEESGFGQQVAALQLDHRDQPEVSGFGMCTDTCFNRWTCLSDSCYLTI
jgi:hypothetical protein